MGCASSTAQHSQRVVPLPPQATNSYIDQYTPLVLMKIRQKFNLHADKQTKDLMIFNFIKLYSKVNIRKEALTKIMFFFYDRLSQNINFAHFIAKYAIITKCEPNVFYRILFQVYKSNSEVDYMTDQQFQVFRQIQGKYMVKQPKEQVFPLFLEPFIHLMQFAQFRVEDYQQNLSLITQQDLPIKAINRQILDCDFNYFIQGNSYFLISEAWFKRWCFYYRNLGENRRSTKFAMQGEHSRRYKQKEASRNQRRRMDSSKGQDQSTLFQQPQTIQFYDVEGEYFGELKQSPKIEYETKPITQNLWHLLCSLHKPEQVFKRVAVNTERLQYYPKSIYYLQANDSGSIVLQSQQIRHLPASFRVRQFKKNKFSAKFGVFSKNFGQKNWREIEDIKVIGEISLDKRFLIALSFNREKFIEVNFRKEIKKNNFQPGDKIYTYFTISKTYQEAYIIRQEQYNYFKVHFKGYSFRYQTKVGRSELSLTEEDALLLSKKNTPTIFKGIPNVGNTCFINSVIQSMAGTPILQQFLINFRFDQKAQPIGYALSLIARALANNQMPEPRHFKTIIDQHMPIFIGNDQQDAQEFFNLLLDKINEELKEKPTIIDYLFGGKIQSKLTCNACKKSKLIQEKMYILSLPIPQAEYNYYSLIVIPVTSKCMKKIVFKLHKNATVAQYCKNFQEKLGESKKDFIFAETHLGVSINKVKEEIMKPDAQSKKVIDVGIIPNVPLLAFQKLPAKYYYSMLGGKSENGFKDFQLNSQMPWTICKINSKAKNQYSLEYINNHEISKASVDKDIVNQLPKLGSHTELFPKKIYLRKYNSSLRKLQSFGLQMLVSIPNWASYDDIMKIVERYTENSREKQGKAQMSNGKPYIIRLFVPNKFKCIFCQKEAGIYNMQAKQIDHCCEILQRDIPLYWAAKSKSYDIFMDWIDFSKCNSSFCSYLELDRVSQNVENARKEEFISLESCLRLHSQPEVVQMQCQKCKQKYQGLQHLISTIPNILVIHMKEFRYTAEGHLIKIDLRFKWQEYLDFSKYSYASNGKIYELYAVVRHSGSSSSGHYTCMAKRKHPFENKKVWVNFDDQNTEFVKPQAFLEQAYLLLFKKVEMPTSSLVIYSDIIKP